MAELTAKANVGAGTDKLLTFVNGSNQHAGAVVLVDTDGNAIPTLPVSASALETLLGDIEAKTQPAGQTTMVNSSPIVIASDQSAIPVTQPDMAVSSFTQAGVIAINTNLLVLDCVGMEGVSIQCVSMGTTGVVTPAWSNDGTTYVNGTILTQAGATAATFNAAGLWTTPVLARYLRLRLTTATTAGTTTLSVHRVSHSSNYPVAAQPVSGTVSISGAPTIGAGTAAIGDVGGQYRANATGAASISHIVSAATTNAANIKASAGRLIGWNFANTTASWQYVKLHNSASAPTAGAGVAMTIGIPPNGLSVSPASFGGVGFSAGIGRTIVTGAADADTTATTLSAVVGDLFFA